MSMKAPMSPYVPSSPLSMEPRHFQTNYLFTFMKPTVQQLVSYLTLQITFCLKFYPPLGHSLGGINYISKVIDQAFAAGSTTSQTNCITIQTIDDMIVAGTKTFTVNMYSNTPGVIIGDRAQGTSVVVNVINIDGKLNAL